MECLVIYMIYHKTMQDFLKNLYIFTLHKSIYKYVKIYLY